MRCPKCPQCGMSAYVHYIRPQHKLLPQGFFCPGCHILIPHPASAPPVIFCQDIGEFLVHHERRYDLILADPPWTYETGAVDSTREVMEKYQCMATEEICALPVANISRKNCVLFLWCPNPKLSEGIQVIQSWGFEFKTSATWMKTRNGKQQMGMGFYFRQTAEQLLVGIRGRPPKPAFKPLQSVFSAARKGHSEKPGVAYDIIERMYPGAEKIELFGRRIRAGWTGVGLEAYAEGSDSVQSTLENGIPIHTKIVYQNNAL